MSLVFLNVNGTNNTVYYCGYGQPNWMTDHNDFVVTAEDSVQAIKDLMVNVNAHTYDVVVGTQPYLTAYYDSTNVIVTLHNPPTPTPTTATFSVLGSTYTEAVANNQAKLPVTVHPSLISQRLEVTVTISGFSSVYVQVGGSGSNVQSQTYQDSSGVVHVVPLNNADLASYWQSQTMNQVWSQVDFQTAIGVLFDLVAKYVVPCLENQTYAPITLTADEQNGLKYIQDNLIPNIPTSFSAVAPSGKPVDVHWASFNAHTYNAKSTTDNYMADRNAIYQYSTLK